MADDHAFHLTLEFADIDELFVVPDTTPLSDTYREHSYTTGVQFVLDELAANPSVKQVHLTIALPATEHTDHLEAESRAAIQRYGRARTAEVDNEIRAIRWRGTRALTVAFIALFVFIGASRLVDSDTSVIRQVISEGLRIAGWVALWFPLELLSFTVWEHRVHRRVLTTLMDADVRVISRAALPADERSDGSS